MDLLWLAKGRASAPGAACKARQRTGKARSAASAWLWRPALGSVLGLVLAGHFQWALADNGRTMRPSIERAAKGERCVGDVATMRRDHMRMLEHQRDATVHGGIRGARHSLKGCIDCHASRTTGSVAAAKTDFCVACHSYAAVKIDCFECHSTKPASALAAAGGKP